MKFKQHAAPYIIAEIGSNHNGDMDLARKLIDSAKACGCDCVKFQSFDTRLFAQEVYERSGFLEDGRDLKSDLKLAVEKYAVSATQLKTLCDYSQQVGIDFSSSAFEPDQAIVLANMDVAFIKIASMDVNNDYLLRSMAHTGKPLVLSSGMATMEEVSHAVEVLEMEGVKDLALLHCVSVYPPEDKNINLRNIDMFSSAFGYTVGFSDHTKGTAIPLAAVARGAAIIEKHFTLDCSMDGWDHAMSADPEEMKALVSDAHRIYMALGSERRVLSGNEVDMKAAMRRSIVAAADIPSGKIITTDDLTYRRPGTGMDPNLSEIIIGMSACNNIPEDSLLKWEDLGVQGKN